MLQLAAKFPPVKEKENIRGTASKSGMDSFYRKLFYVLVYLVFITYAVPNSCLFELFDNLQNYVIQ